VTGTHASETPRINQSSAINERTVNFDNILDLGRRLSSASAETIFLSYRRRRCTQALGPPREITALVGQAETSILVLYGATDD
jgi:hypothetical protein